MNQSLAIKYIPPQHSSILPSVGIIPGSARSTNPGQSEPFAKSSGNNPGTQKNNLETSPKRFLQYLSVTRHSEFPGSRIFKI